MAACVLYAVNRWLIKPQVESPLFDNWFNDALLIPCALPIVLRAHRWLGLRGHDLPPTSGEILTHLLGWTALFELVGPCIVRHATGDPADVMAYTIGAVVAWCSWSRT
jgi:hypothetical protein